MSVRSGCAVGDGHRVDAHRLALLAEVVRAGSIAAAATRLSFTASAVSQQIAALERELGGRVLDRHPRGVTPTPLGAAMLGHAEAVAGELRAAGETARALLGGAPGQVTIGTFSTAGTTLLPSVLAAFRRDHPEVGLRLLDLEPPDGYDLVVTREVDLLVTHRYPGSALPSARGLARVLLRRERFRLVLPLGHRLVGGRPSLGELAGEEWISGSPGMHNRICLDHLADERGLALRVAYETRDYQAVLALVEVGLGVAFVPEDVVGRARVAVLDCADANPDREVHLVHPVRPSPLVADLVGRLRRV
ncbi:DNA-binding transcriptional regulator, LysR family [Actinosynnema pretiosum]|nr:DNA-binding transcriptional regulator, LysR family [Actinosynnema pretiosum]